MSVCTVCAVTIADNNADAGHRCCVEQRIKALSVFMLELYLVPVLSRSAL